MKQIIALLKRGFVSSSVKTPEFKAFARLFKKHFGKEVTDIGATLVSFNVGHFYVSGFFQLDNGKMFYFSLSDVRDFEFKQDDFTLLIRTAQHAKDYTGGRNTYAKIETGMLRKYFTGNPMASLLMN